MYTILITKSASVVRYTVCGSDPTFHTHTHYIRHTYTTHTKYTKKHIYI